MVYIYSKDSMSCEQQQKQKDRPSSKNKNIFGIFNVPETSSSSSSASVGTVSRLSVDHQLLSLSVTNNSNGQFLCRSICSNIEFCLKLVAMHSEWWSSNKSGRNMVFVIRNHEDDTFILRKVKVEEKNIYTNTSCKMAIYLARSLTVSLKFLLI